MATGTIWIPNHHALIASFIFYKKQVQREKYPQVEHVTLYNYLEILLRETIINYSMIILNITNSM